MKFRHMTENSVFCFYGVFKMNSLRCQLKNRKGQSTVEFAFVIISLFVVFCMLTGLTQIAYNWVVLQYAASEASRFGSLGLTDAGFPSREDSIRNRVQEIIQNLGLNQVIIEFLDESGGSTAGSSSEYFRMKLSRAIQLQGLPRFFLKTAGWTDDQVPVYEVIAWTVIRNEPF